MPQARSTSASSLHIRRILGEGGFDINLRPVCSKAIKDHFAHATVAQHFKAYEGKPLAIPAEAAGPKPEYLEWHRVEVFGK